MLIPVINKSHNELPKYANEGDAGLDLRAELSAIQEKFLFGAEIVLNENGENSVVLHPEGRALIPTELYAAIPKGYEIQVRPRSGLALKYGITVLNTPGTIDSGYRNSWGVILKNEGSEDFVINPGDRIAQAVLAEHEVIEWVPVESLDESERGLSGFGKSGIK